MTTTSEQPEPTQPDSRLGLLAAIGAYGCWGVIALYFKTVAHVAPPEVLAHRAIWSFAFLAVVISASGQWGAVGRALRNRKALGLLALSTLVIAINWLAYIYAVSSSQLLEASLGYFINPLVNVLLGVAVLGERLRPYQRLSIALALIGVGISAVMLGRLPWLALLLAISFSLYGLLRKTMPVAGLVGLTIETLLLTPLALIYLAWLRHNGAITGEGGPTLGLLALSGLVTSIPLLLFVAGARRLRLSTLGIVQYLSPSLQFSVAVAVFHEPLAMSRLASFAFIWAAVAIYAADSLRAHRQRDYELLEPD